MAALLSFPSLGALPCPPQTEKETQPALCTERDGDAKSQKTRPQHPPFFFAESPSTANGPESLKDTL